MTCKHLLLQLRAGRHLQSFDFLLTASGSAAAPLGPLDRRPSAPKRCKVRSTGPWQPFLQAPVYTVLMLISVKIQGSQQQILAGALSFQFFCTFGRQSMSCGL